jgi:hypothetical protein
MNSSQSGRTDLIDSIKGYPYCNPFLTYENPLTVMGKFLQIYRFRNADE